MAGSWFRMPDGTAVHVKHAAARRKRCACGQLADRECDWCDRPVCVRCSTRRGEVDACPEHLYEMHERLAIQGLAV